VKYGNLIYTWVYIDTDYISDKWEVLFVYRKQISWISWKLVYNNSIDCSITYYSKRSLNPVESVDLNFAGCKDIR